MSQVWGAILLLIVGVLCVYAALTLSFPLHGPVQGVPSAVQKYIDIHPN